MAGSKFMVHGHHHDQLRSLLLQLVGYQDLGLQGLRPEVLQTYRALRRAAKRLSRRLRVSYSEQLSAARVDYHSGAHRKVHPSNPPKPAPIP